MSQAETVCGSLSFYMDNLIEVAALVGNSPGVVQQSADDTGGLT